MTRTQNMGDPKRCKTCDQNQKQEFETLWYQTITVKMARDNNSNWKGGNKPRRRGNHKQEGNRDKFRGPANKQSNAILKLEPSPEPTKTASVKILDDGDNKVKEKLPNY